MKQNPHTEGVSAAKVAGPATDHEELARAERPLVVEPYVGTPDAIERQWYEQVYRGRGDRMAQLTVRAVVMGSILGGVLSLTNLYIGLKAGWCFGVAVTACILSYAIWTGLCRVGVARTPMTILENNCMQSTASAAGYSTGSTLVSAFSAYLMINERSLPLGLMMGWVFFVALLGVTMAIPMKRQMINLEQLRFPTGVAAATTLQALYTRAGEAMRSARALGIAGVVAAASTFWMDGLRLVRGAWEPFGLGELIQRLNAAVFGPAWMGRTVMFHWDPVFLAAGAITGLRVSLSMFVGGTLCWAVFVPWLQAKGVITGTGFRDVVQWTLWGGTACMVTSGLVAFGMSWRSAVRAFRGLGAMFRRRAGVGDEMERIEAPGSWFVAGQAVGFLGLAWLGWRTFDMPLWQTAVAVALTFGLALVACRVTGETDTTPLGAMGKVTQLIFGGLSPGNMNVNLMSANITSGSSLAAADLLTDLKSGYLLGANPRRQFLAQFAGIFTGTLVTVLAFRLLVPEASVLGSNQFPAPAAQTWRAVALALSQGFGVLEPLKLWSLGVGGAVGVVLAVLPAACPKSRAWLPSAAGLGLSWTMHWYYGLLFFLGAVAAEAYRKRVPNGADTMTYPVASGVIAGGSLMGVILIFWENGPALIRQLLSGTLPGH